MKNWLITYLSNRSENTSASARWPGDVERRARNQAEQSNGHGGGGDAKADIHAGVSLEPNEESQGQELAGAECEVGGVEVRRKHMLIMMIAALIGNVNSELISSVRDDVGLKAATSQGHQVKGCEQYRRLEPSCFLTLLLINIICS